MPTLFQQSDTPTRIVNPPVPPAAPRRTIMTPLTCYAMSPDSMRFETQEPDETIVLFLRQHIIVLVPSVFLVFILLITPIVLLPFLSTFLTVPLAIPPNYFLVGTIFWYVMTFGVAIMNFLRWFYNIYIVTNKRVVDVDFIHLLYKEFSEARLDKIQDISFKSGGIFAAFFNYGDVLVETAGETPNVEFYSVPKPAQVVETISSLLEQIKS